MADGAGTIDGDVATVKWSYYNAAAINRYRVTRITKAGATSWYLRATILIADKFKMTQRPLIFVAPYNGGRLQWPIVDFDIQGDQLIADLGPPIT